MNTVQVPTAEHFGSFVVERYNSSDLRGLFILYQIIPAKDKREKSQRKVLAEGVDLHVVSTRMREALDARLNRRPTA